MLRVDICLKMMKYLFLICMVSGITACSHQPVKVLHFAVAQTQVSPIVSPPSLKPKIALVLGSGGARGYAHIGVIDVLERYDIKPDFIVGSSAGSIVGALYASGKTAAEIEKIALQLRASDVRGFTLSKQGFFDGQKIENYMNGVVDYKPLEQLKIPLYIVATDLKKGVKVVFSQGNTGQAVRASTTIPSMFIPTEIGGVEYVDGGLVSPLPVETAKQLGADIIIAVDILARPEYTKTDNIWGLFNQNINVMQNQLASNEAKFADVVIQPDIREKQHVFSIKSRSEAILAGKKAALAQIKNILMRVDEKNIEQKF